MAFVRFTGRGNRDDGQPPQRGDVEQLFGGQSQAVTLACVVEARAPGRVQDNDGMSGEHHGDGQASRHGIDHRLRPHGREQPSPPSFCC